MDTQWSFHGNFVSKHQSQITQNGQNLRILAKKSTYQVLKKGQKYLVRPLWNISAACFSCCWWLKSLEPLMLMKNSISNSLIDEKNIESCSHMHDHYHHICWHLNFFTTYYNHPLFHEKWWISIRWHHFHRSSFISKVIQARTSFLPENEKKIFWNITKTKHSSLHFTGCLINVGVIWFLLQAIMFEAPCTSWYEKGKERWQFMPPFFPSSALLVEALFSYSWKLGRGAARWQMGECQKQWHGLCHHWKWKWYDMHNSGSIIKLGNSYKLPCSQNHLSSFMCHKGIYTNNLECLESHQTKPWQYFTFYQVLENSAKNLNFDHNCPLGAWSIPACL